MADNIFATLDRARAAFPAIVKNRVNPHFKSRYADLEAILDVVEPVLRDHGLCLFQTVLDNKLHTEVHRTEGTGAATCILPLPEEVDSQKLGSAITYARRYGIVTLLGLVTEDDDDGNATKAPAPAPTAQHDQGGTDGGQTTTPAPRPVLPSGWFSDDDCVQAHNLLADRISKLPTEGLEACKTYREKHGWPMPAEALKVLEAQVTKVEDEAEKTAVANVQDAFPGAEEAK